MVTDWRMDNANWWLRPKRNPYGSLLRQDSINIDQNGLRVWQKKTEREL
jgi:hypothetical protein